MAALFLVLTAFGGDYCGPANPSYRLDLVVDSRGSVTATFTISHPASDPANGDTFVLVLPVALQQGYRIAARDDVFVAHLSHGHGYTLISVAPAHGLSTYVLSIDNAMTLIDTQDGRAKVELDLAYTHMSQAARSRLLSKAALLISGATVVLPNKYDPADIGLQDFKHGANDTSFDLVISQSPGRAWVAFPSPGRGALDTAKLTISMLVGLLAIGFQLSSLRDRRMKSLIFILLIATAILGCAWYFSLALPKSLEFLVYAAAAIPSAVFTAFGCLYVLIAGVFQSRVSGQIRIDGAPPRYVPVSLVKLDAGPAGAQVSTEVSQRHELKDGRYDFHIWTRRNDQRRFCVVASFSGKEARSGDFRLKRREIKEVPVLSITL